MNSRKIKILFTIPNFDTAGSGKVVHDLAKSLDKTLFDVEIACGSNKGAYFKVIELLGLKIHIVPTTTSYHPIISLPFRLLTIARFFRENKYDIIHSWHWSSDWTEALAARLAGVKWVYTKKAMSWGSARNWKIRSKLATFITTINPDMADLYFKGYKNVRLLPLGLDTNFYCFQEKAFTVGDVSYNKEDFVVISVVNLIKAKGLEVLVDAFKLITDKHIKLLIVGDYSSEYGQGIYDKVQQENMADRIKFTGKVLDVRQYIALSDMFVTPTNVNWEGMPMAPVEAMSSGRIVVGTDTSGINFILKDFEQFLVPPNDAPAIAEKIKFVASLSTSQRNDLSRRYREKVCREFSIDKFASNYQNLYLELCKKN